MAITPPNDTPSSTEEESSDAKHAAAAAAAREEAIRSLLDAPDLLPPRPPGPRLVPIAPTDNSGVFAQPPSLPVIPSAARLASAPLSLLEGGLGILVLGLALTLAFMGWSEFQSRARAARCATEFRELAAAFEGYHRSAGTWPAIATAPGVFPPGMERLLPVEIWTRPTPLGGHYAWVTGAGKNRPALGITAFVPDPPLRLSREERERIDRLLDDGDLTTGRFQAGFNGWPVYFLTGAN